MIFLRGSSSTLTMVLDSLSIAELRKVLRDYGIKETASSKQELQQVKETLIRTVFIDRKLHNSLHIDTKKHK